MSLVKEILSGWGKTTRRSAEQAVMVHLELTGGSFGSEDEVEEIRLLGDDCEELVREQRAGAFEGEEFGDAECVLYFAGPDAEQIWHVISPIVRASRLARGGHVVQRFGAPGSREARVAIST